MKGLVRGGYLLVLHCTLLSQNLNTFNYFPKFTAKWRGLGRWAVKSCFPGDTVWPTLSELGCSPCRGRCGHLKVPDTAGQCQGWPRVYSLFFFGVCFFHFFFSFPAYSSPLSPLSFTFYPFPSRPLLVSHPVLLHTPFFPSRHSTFCRSTKARLLPASDRAGLLLPTRERAGGTGSVMWSFLTWKQQFCQKNSQTLKSDFWQVSVQGF